METQGTSLVSNFDTKVNFWECYPAYTIIEPFKGLYNKDKSKNKTKSSKLMWAFSFVVEENKENPIANLPENEKRQIIQDDYLENLEISWEDHEDHIEELRRLRYSKSKLDLIQWEQKLEERRKFIRDTPYELDRQDVIKDKVVTLKGTADQLDKMAANTIKIYELVDKLKEMISKEEEAGNEVKGGRRESAGERGII